MSDSATLAIAVFSILIGGTASSFAYRRAASVPIPTVTTAADVFSGFLLTFLVVMFVRGIGREIPDPLLSTLAVAACLILTGWLATRQARLRLPGILEDFDSIGRQALRGAVLYVVACPAVFAVHVLHQRYLMRDPESTQRSVSAFLEAAWPLKAAQSVQYVLAVPWLEELIFRVFLLTAMEVALRSRWSPRAARIGAVVGSTMAFTLVHEPFTWLPIALIGGWLSMIFARTRSVITVTVFHGLHNGLTLAYHAFET